MDGNDAAAGKCPVMHGGMTSARSSVTSWWPEALNLDILHQHDPKTSPMGGEFDFHKTTARISRITVIDYHTALHNITTSATDYKSFATKLCFTTFATNFLPYNFC